MTTNIIGTCGERSYSWTCPGLMGHLFATFLAQINPVELNLSKVFYSIKPLSSPLYTKVNAIGAFSRSHHLYPFSWRKKINTAESLSKPIRYDLWMNVIFPLNKILMIEVTSHIIYLSNVQLALPNFGINESYYYRNLSVRLVRYQYLLVNKETNIRRE